MSAHVFTCKMSYLVCAKMDVQGWCLNVFFFSYNFIKVQESVRKSRLCGALKWSFSSYVLGGHEMKQSTKVSTESCPFLKRLISNLSAHFWLGLQRILTEFSQSFGAIFVQSWFRCRLHVTNMRRHKTETRHILRVGAEWQGFNYLCTSALMSVMSVTYFDAWALIKRWEIQ